MEPQAVVAGVGVASGKLLSWHDIVEVLVSAAAVCCGGVGGSGGVDNVRGGVLLVPLRTLAILVFVSPAFAVEEIELELGLGFLVGIETFIAASHDFGTFISLVAAFGVENEWWEHTVIKLILVMKWPVQMKRLNWSLGMTSELAEVDGVRRQGGWFFTAEMQGFLDSVHLDVESWLSAKLFSVFPPSVMRFVTHKTFSQRRLNWIQLSNVSCAVRNFTNHC